MTEGEKLFFTRRQMLIKGGATALSTLILPNFSFASSLSRHERHLHLYSKHTGEWFKEPYWVEGHYIPQALKQLNHLLRDKLNSKKIQIDKGILDLMHAIQRKIGVKKPFEIICGYRSPETNALLRKRSKKVAEKSLHLKGRAVDMRMDGIKLSHLRDAAKSLKAGGVGYYPHSNFIHIDVRPQLYYW